MPKTEMEKQRLEPGTQGQRRSWPRPGLRNRGRHDRPGPTIRSRAAAVAPAVVSSAPASSW
ncbi:MAG: hypothetical protein ACRENV_00940, partial [Candidatus Dormibacteria bacterium]